MAQHSPILGSPIYKTYSTYSVKTSLHNSGIAQPTMLRVDVHRPKLGGSADGALSPVSRELPMPNVTRIYNLGQAHATLLHCWNKLSRMARENAIKFKKSTAVADRSDYHHWLDRWEQAFTDFLSSAMPSMTTEDLTQCRVLKANHLACAILASDAGSKSSDYDVFEAEFQAIVELCGAVLRSRHEAASPKSTTSSNKDYSPTSGTLDVRDALHVVASRCPYRKVRSRASDLLTQYYT